MKSPSKEEQHALPDNYWDIKDLSSYLKIKTKTLYAMISEIPHYRIGRLIRFKKEEIDSWLESKRQIAQKAKKIEKRESSNYQINSLIRKTIDQEKQGYYNPLHGKSDRIKAQGKENNHGSI